jgi:hypothetical protein
MLYESDAIGEGCCEKAGGLRGTLTTVTVCETSGGMEELRNIPSQVLR